MFSDSLNGWNLITVRTYKNKRINFVMEAIEHHMDCNIYISSFFFRMFKLLSALSAFDALILIITLNDFKLTRM